MSIFFYWNKLSTSNKIFIIVYLLCFAIATCTHSIDIFTYGIFPYKNQPLWANIYWTLLTILDPFAILLILVNITPGLVLYFLIIFTDVIINFTFRIKDYGIKGIMNIFQIGQLMCLLFFILTIKKIVKEIK